MSKFPGCQLAHEWRGWPECGDPSYYHVEPKLDGFRLLAICDVDGITYHCRGEATPGWAEHLEHITTALNRLRNDSALEQPIMFDGEIMAASWNETSKLLRRKRSAMSADLKERIIAEVRFSVFDMVYLDQLEYVAPLRKSAKARQSFLVPFRERRALLEEAFLGVSGPVQLGMSVAVPTLQEVDDLFAEFLELGYEGAIIKNPHAPYCFERSVGWLKRKPIKTLDVRIIGFTEGIGRHYGRLGSFKCINAAGEAIDVGGGFTDDQRAKFWAARESLPGKAIEIKVQDDAVSVARHPVFLRFRDDTNKE